MPSAEWTQDTPVDSNGKITLRHAGRLHHIGIGRTHARTPLIILLLIADLDIRIIHATTGQLLRHLTLDPTCPYQPLGQPAEPPPPKPPQPDPKWTVGAVRDLMKDHKRVGGRSRSLGTRLISRSDVLSL
jgi:hypothetical protein